MRFDKVTKKRLSDLGRGMARGEKAGEEPAEVVSPQPAKVLTVGEVEEFHGPLETLLAGEAQASREGEYYELRTPVAEYGDWAIALARQWLEGCCGLEELAASGNPSPAEVVFFDTETTGLSNEPLFLAGLLTCQDGEPVVVQLLARDYSEEAAVLAETARRLAAAQLVVTYNGTSFDLPYVRNRLRYHRMKWPGVPRHLDLLLIARRKLGRSLGNCRLQTLERRLCLRERCNDIPGAQIPQAYHDFVADGDAGRLCRIIEHNSFDVLTLAELMTHLAPR